MRWEGDLVCWLEIGSSRGIACDQPGEGVGIVSI